MELCIFGMLAVTSSGPALTGVMPSSLEQAPDFGRLAAIALWMGCVGSFIGIVLPNRDRGLLLEQVALIPAAFGAFFWGCAVFFNQWKQIFVDHPWWKHSWLAFASGAIAIGLSLGFTSACIVRWIQIQRYVRLRRLESGGT
jgi:hypothetical protein